jgi:hypothetical protein
MNTRAVIRPGDIYDDAVTERPEDSVLTQEAIQRIADRLREKGMLPPLPICSGIPPGISFEEYWQKIRTAGYLPCFSAADRAFFDRLRRMGNLQPEEP